VKFRLTTPWPATGAFCIDAGTVLDGASPTWNGVALPVPFPADAVPLDTEAFAKYSEWWPLGDRTPGA
jgi:hypothetical protein